jgi:hypothetical protein
LTLQQLDSWWLTGDNKRITMVLLDKRGDEETVVILGKNKKKCPPRALTCFPRLARHAGRGPMRIRCMAGAIWSAAGTFKNICITQVRALKSEYLYKYEVLKHTWESAELVYLYAAYPCHEGRSGRTLSIDSPPDYLNHAKIKACSSRIIWTS